MEESYAFVFNKPQRSSMMEIFASEIVRSRAYMTSKHSIRPPETRHLECNYYAFVSCSEPQIRDFSKKLHTTASSGVVYVP